MISRRNFLTAMAATPLLSSVLMAETMHSASTEASGSLADAAPGLSFPAGHLIKPKGLSAKSKIAVTAPASPCNPWEMRTFVKLFESMGMKVEFGDTIKKQTNDYKYFSAPDQQRLDEFMAFAKRDDIDAIICGRGGYGVMRILNQIDYATINAHPKIYMGFSDITALLLAIQSQAGLVAYHGPVAASSFNQFTQTNMFGIINQRTDNKTHKVTVPDMQVLSEGKTQGLVQGGNLRIISSVMGTKYEIDTRDSILFLEDVAEQPYEIDRMLSQLMLAGKLQSCRGIMLGQFKNLDKRKNFYPNKSFTLREVFTQILAPLKIPVMLNVPFGHVESKLTLPLGTLCEIDTKTKTIEFIESPVA